ncbi:cobalt-precorrin 5A hydrolase [Methanocalculus taiwanensis]|uniref:Cobalt-precorrin 5A hydrolase n=1 Tax=Methanocalculus taiwanensis TaxID=106207 RepID=A0ABD4TLG4_9EURY|nr:cobalt-precorrin 5A hydrolase [Methanocalculus taiwanensis]MCQ1539132.1 cobalt-precorrin 5A hydrolase [Methanocalculus taiwanensis]
MKYCIIALPRFSQLGEKIAEAIDADILPYEEGIFKTAFADYKGIIAVMSAGIVIRSIAPLLTDKWHDPGIVVVTPDGKYGIPILGGHHGANDLASRLGEIGIIPVISTATEVHGRPSVEGYAQAVECRVINRPSTRRVNAAFLDGDVPVYEIPKPGIVVAGPGVSVLIRSKPYTIGIGARLGITPEEVVDAVTSALREAGIRADEVGAFATTEKKRPDQGLAEGISRLGGVLIYLGDDMINSIGTASPSRAGLIGLCGVAEPAAIACSEKGELIMKKKIYGRVTIAIGR